MKRKKNMSEQKHQSLLAKFLTPEVQVQLASVSTRAGFTLDNVIRSGVENPDSSVGVYAPDAEAYEAFAPLFSPIIEAYHGHKKTDTHRRDLNVSNLKVENLDPSGTRIVSTRVRVGRNLEGYPLAPGISREERNEVERRVVDALSTLTGDLAGEYYPIAGMKEEVRAKLVADHFLFKQGDRFLESAGANRNWPEGRGIFHSADKQFLVWVNEEDQMRIISMEMGADLKSVFDRLSRAVTALEKKLKFAYSERLGYLSSCPTNLGTVMRGSFMMKLPKLSQQANFKSICAEMGLSVRGVDGEHSESKGGMYDISNKRRLGISEVEGVQVLYDGAKKLLELEDSLA